MDTKGGLFQLRRWTTQATCRTRRDSSHRLKSRQLHKAGIARLCSIQLDSQEYVISDDRVDCYDFGEHCDLESERATADRVGFSAVPARIHCRSWLLARRTGRSYDGPVRTNWSARNGAPVMFMLSRRRQTDFCGSAQCRASVVGPRYVVRTLEVCLFFALACSCSAAHDQSYRTTITLRGPLRMALLIARYGLYNRRQTDSFG
jgi:hypothetical protein